ncbi:metallophosphoesterase [uncultured Bacteroides sp.]|uniref:metallophosphoesterase n=1 Tax=uncultured Bacteroides sp. TaxID=162156 RepID=UPI002AA6F402|nr:metallophosphoesterase [uncultured Bacteroides sp.]
MKRIIWVYISFFWLFTSCATINLTHPGIGRVKKYEFAHKDVPEAFNGFKIVFISDLHYKSRFTRKRLTQLVRLINKLHPDVLLMGGDYQEGCDVVPELCARLADIKTSYGIFGVMGNNDDERCHDEIIQEMKIRGIKILEHQLDTIRIDNERLILAGVRNPFDLKTNGISPTLSLSPSDFVILLTHTPDYAEEVPVTNTDLVLAGHTHGGQVTLFGLYAPIIPSAYGQRFRTGLKYTSAHIPMIITNGIGTSRIPIRLFAPSEVVVITLSKAL